MRFMKRSLLVAALLAFPGALAAQSADVAATANVLAQLTVAAEQDLDFGNVIPGFVRTVAPADLGDAGRFSLQGADGLEVALDFGALPTELVGPGGATLPLSFGAASAGYGATSGAVDDTFDPSAVENANLSGTGELYVFIGGTVTPDAAQAAGSYTGLITLTVSYTGN
jgi:hypothetical protein